MINNDASTFYSLEYNITISFHFWVGVTHLPILYTSLGKGSDQELSASEHLVDPKYLHPCIS